MLTITNAGAADWTVTPDISLRETYTDNVFLGSGSREHDFITQVSPGIRVDGRSRRLTAGMSYRPSALFYARHDEANDIANHLAASARLEAVERFFFVDAAASVSQDFISPFAARPGDLATRTPNRLESRSASLSPFVRGELARALEYELRNRNTWTSTDHSALGDIHTTQWSARVARPVRLFGWSLEYDDTETRYEEFTGRPDQESSLYRLRLFFQPDYSWRFSASAGEEENNFLRGTQERYTMYGVGASWRPSQRTALDAEYEDRYFGASRLARFNHRTRLTAWSLAYSRNASSFQEEVLRLPPGNTAALLDAIFAARIPDPAERRLAVEQFMRSTGTPGSLANSLAFYTERIFLREALDASFAILGVRNSITFTAFRGESTALSPQAAAIVPDAFNTARRIRQNGFGVRADHRLTPFTTLGAGATSTYSRQDEPAGPDTRNDYFTLTLNHTVSPKTTTFAGVSISRFDSEDASLESRNATSVFVGMNHRF